MFINVMPPITAEIEKIELRASIDLPSQESPITVILDERDLVTAEIDGHLKDHPIYVGPYEVYPTIEDQLLETNRYLMRGDVIVHRIPFYIHNQITSSAVWNVEHMLHKRPSVTVVDSADNTVLGDVEYLDDDHVRITFNSEFSGKAYCN